MMNTCSCGEILVDDTRECPKCGTPNLHYKEPLFSLPGAIAGAAVLIGTLLAGLPSWVGLLGFVVGFAAVRSLVDSRRRPR